MFEHKVINDYEIIKRIGRGGIAEVYLGRLVRLKQKYVAIKRLLPGYVDEKYFKTKIEQEAEIQSVLGKHPHIVGVENFFEEGGEYFIVMAFITSGTKDPDGYPSPARTLKEYIEEGIPLSQILVWFKQICSAIGYAHKHGVIHRDLKPSNIMVDEFNIIKVADFGIAKILGAESGRTKTGTQVGTLPYMSPEQILGGHIGPYTDIYALGIILHKMVTGDYPYDFDTSSSGYKIEKAHVEETPDLSKVGDVHLREIIAKCLEKEPKNRYQKIEDLLKDLEKIGEVESKPKPSAKPITELERVIVPLLVGKTKDEAIRELVRLGLQYRMRFIEGKDGVVLGQDITDGKRVEKGSVIEIVVGKEAVKNRIKVPELIGLEIDLAIKKAEEVGFRTIVRSEEYSDNVDEGLILEQNPAPDVLMLPGTLISLVVSKGRKPVAKKKKTSVFAWLIPLIIIAGIGIYVLIPKEKPKFPPDQKEYSSERLGQGVILEGKRGQMFPPQINPEVASASSKPGLTYLGKNSRGYEEYRHNKTGIILIKIPAGTFTMGSDASDAYSDEKPVHTVYLDEYYIGKYEVTNAQYKKFCDATGRSYPKDPYFTGMPNYFRNYPDYPVVNVNWEDVKAFCDWAGLRLPTEAEWEKAARGKDQRKYPWGEEDPNAGGFYRCNYWGTDSLSAKKDGFKYTAPVGSYDRGVSPYGCYDMAGNVWEWCADWYDENYYARSANNNPKGPSSGVDRVLRGGSWNDNAWNVRCAYRHRSTPTYWNRYFGFRVGSPAQ